MVMGSQCLVHTVLQIIKKVVKKTNTKKHECSVATLKSTGHPQDVLNDMRSREVQMIDSDKSLLSAWISGLQVYRWQHFPITIHLFSNVQRTMEAKNAVEAYIYDMRTKVNEGGIFFDFIFAKDRQAFMAAMSSAEDWL